MQFGFQAGPEPFPEIYSQIEYTDTVSWNYITGIRRFEDGLYTLKLLINGGLVDSITTTTEPDLSQTNQTIGIGNST